MTDLETFKAMLDKRKAKYDVVEYPIQGDAYVHVTIEVGAGIAGSHTSYVSMVFMKNTGDYVDANHCD